MVRSLLCMREDLNSVLGAQVRKLGVLIHHEKIYNPPWWGAEAANPRGLLVSQHCWLLLTNYEHFLFFQRTCVFSGAFHVFIIILKLGVC